MTIQLVNQTWGLQVVWEETDRVLDNIQDKLRGPNRSREADIAALKSLASWRSENLFDETVKGQDRAVLAEVIKDTRPGWQFWRGEGGYLYGYKDIWAGTMVGGKAPPPFKAKTAVKMADRIRAYEVHRVIIKKVHLSASAVED